MFVVFEGIDGSGKTTVSNLVAERLRQAGLEVRHLRAEGKFVSAVSEAIRELGRDARNLELVPEAEFLLYVARDVQLIEEALRPALRTSDVVLADRFLYTAEVLGKIGRQLPATFVAPILAAAAGGLEPDLVVLVDVDPALARARRKSFKLAAADRRPPARKGLAGVGLQHRLRRGYLELARAAPERWVVVKNEESLEDTVALVANLIRDAHERGVGSVLAGARTLAGVAQAANDGAGTANGVTAGRAPSLDSPEEALAAFLAWLDRRAVREPRVAAYFLGGLAGRAVDERRLALAELVPEAVLAALAGLDDDASWRLRQRFGNDHPRAVARTLVGLAAQGARAAGLRRELEAVAPADVAMSLGRLADEASWAARERLYPVCPEPVVGSLSTLASERAWALREIWLGTTRDKLGTSYELACAAARSVTGLEDERAWSIRRAVRALAPVAALSSLNRASGPESWRWRREHLARAPKVVMATLAGLEHPEAWDMRAAVAGHCKEAIDSILAMDHPQAWELRDRHRDTWPSTVAKSLGPLADGERGKDLLLGLLRAYPDNVSLLKHAAAVALGLHRQAGVLRPPSLTD
jgi:dTMP kinase